ncbi:uncharacterized protein LOC133525267 [Cydia pomonella]|uniref:uncharacterized protein LOC133525267 n=1 Tax=Cydia pomonella TaxID=82600 RepID=UPI002ADE5104|nr:uncharacterized protein LOC133525267 [Cydia pomonella]
MSPEEVVMLCAAYIIMHKCKAKKKKKRWWMRNYLMNRTYVFDDLRGFDGSFQNFTRMSRSDFETLLGLIGPAITRQETKFRHPIEPQRRLAITLRFIATGDLYGSLSYTFKVSKQIISKIIPEVCQELINVLKDYVKVPQTEQEWKKKARQFELLWNFPHCIGSIDGKHIVIEAPFNSGSDYFNYKEQFSIILLAIVNADYNFICICELWC